MTYEMKIAGLTRHLPLCRITDDLYIGAFVMLGDQEICVAGAAELLKRVPGEYDYLLTAETKGIPLVHEMARQTGAKTYFIARKEVKTYMPDAVGVEVNSITTQHRQQLFLSGEDAAMIRGKRILLVDDVITTGTTAAACAQALLHAGADSVFALAFATVEFGAPPDDTTPICEDDEEDEDADVVAVGLGQHGDDAVVEDVQHRALKGKVRVQQAAGEDADEEGGVDLLRDEREDDGYDGRQQRPGRAVKAAYGLLRLAAVREHAHDERADDERQDGDERRQGADFSGLVHFFSHSFCFITAGYPQTASACGYRYRFSFP